MRFRQTFFLIACVVVLTAASLKTPVDSAPASRVVIGGKITEFSGPTGGVLRSIAPGPDGNIWFVEDSRDKVQPGCVTDEPRDRAAGKPRIDLDDDGSSIGDAKLDMGGSAGVTDRLDAALCHHLPRRADLKIVPRSPRSSLRGARATKQFILRVTLDCFGRARNDETALA